jgi:hypothetical protein
MVQPQALFTVFEGSRCIAAGSLAEVASAAKDAIDRSAAQAAAVLVFDDASGDTVELDWRGSAAEFQARLQAGTRPGGTATVAAADPPSEQPTARGPGRPKLGVVAREVTLLPRHWEWLGTQSGGASVALRKLVDAARKSSEHGDRVRRSSAVAYKFMSTLAGHEPGFEEASRALFALDPSAFAAHTAAWPVDVQAHLRRLLAAAFASSAGEPAGGP